MIFALVQFSIPEVEVGVSDFREIPLLISIFYLKHPLWIAIECGISLINLPPTASPVQGFVTHFFPLWLGWIYYQKFLIHKKNQIYPALLWAMFAFTYYTVLMIPLAIVLKIWFGVLSWPDFFGRYFYMLSSLRFEMLSTLLVTTIFLVQVKTRRSLEAHEKNLVVTIEQKTKALEKANSELTSMNENLDRLVKERSKTVHDQFDQLLRYAHHNSHTVRAPLSRMQGLMLIILQEKDTESKMALIEKLKTSSEELDTEVVRMNQILESEILKEKK